MKLLIFALAAVSLVGCEREKTPTTDVEKYSYAIGYNFAKNLDSQKVDFDVASLKQAIVDVKGNKPSRLGEEEMQTAMRKLYEERQTEQAAVAKENLTKGQEFLEANKGKDGVKVTKSGLQYRIIEEGSGSKPKDTDTVVVHYKGTLIDGTEFDSSYKTNQPAEFPVRAVIPGWTEALQLMKKGAKYELFIPSELAYGERGRPSIPPNSVLLFEVELLDIKKK